MQPAIWKSPIALSIREEQVSIRIRRAKLFVFLRSHRHELFDESFQQELASLYRPSKRGTRPSPLRNWRWRSFCKRTPASLTTK